MVFIYLLINYLSYCALSSKVVIVCGYQLQRRDGAARTVVTFQLELQRAKVSQSSGRDGIWVKWYLSSRRLPYEDSIPAVITV